MNVDPRNITLEQWAADTTLPLSRLCLVPLLLDPKGWKQWAQVIIQSRNVAVYTPPDPSRFDDWRDWAFRFNQAVPL